MKCVQPSAHPGHTDLRRGEGFVVRLREQVFEVQFLYLGVGCFLQNGEDIQYMYNVTLWHVRANIAAVGKQ